MPVRSRRLWGPTTITQAGLVLYTVPADRTAVVRQIVVTSVSGVVERVTLRVNGSSGVPTLARWDLAAGQTVTLANVVLNPGDTLHAVAQNATLLTSCSGFGSLLEGAPE